MEQAVADFKAAKYPKGHVEQFSLPDKANKPGEQSLQFAVPTSFASVPGEHMSHRTAASADEEYPFGHCVQRLPSAEEYVPFKHFSHILFVWSFTDLHPDGQVMHAPLPGSLANPVAHTKH
jgi:hypothetical protein